MKKNFRNLALLIVGLSSLCSFAQAKSRKPASTDRNVKCEGATFNINFTILANAPKVPGQTNLPISNITLDDVMDKKTISFDNDTVKGYFLDEADQFNQPMVLYLEMEGTPNADGRVFYRIRAIKSADYKGNAIYKGPGLIDGNTVVFNCVVPPETN